MSRLHFILVLLLAYLMVYAEVSIDFCRNWLGAQVDCLPALMVYVALTYGPGAITTLAVLGGVWFDSLSANPAGISIIPLLVLGWAIHQVRFLILRDQRYAQFVLGLAASAVAPLITLMLLLTIGENPLLGLASFWQWMVMALGGAVLTPLLFKLLDRLTRWLNYPLAQQAAFRSDREIKRGRF